MHHGLTQLCCIFSVCWTALADYPAIIKANLVMYKEPYFVSGFS